ncbi:MAG: glycosyltransferase [Leptospiraceae bacterium]|nr:glycosyltransferase [Leptospiraceae bacterium]
MPVKSAPDTVTAAIQSILHQTLRTFELIVICNQCDSETKSRVLQVSDARLVVIEYNHLASVALALNAGLALARGQFIARMDADDVSCPERLELQAAALSKNESIQLVSGLVRFESRLADARGFKRYVDWQNSLLGASEIYANRYVESPLVHPSIMMRSECLRQLCGWQEGGFPEDYDLWLRFFAAGHRAVRLPVTVLVWNDHQDRLTRVDSRYLQTAFTRIKMQHLIKELQARQIGTGLDCRSLVFWGAGRYARRIIRLLQDAGFQIEALLEVHPGRIGQRIHGIPVVTPGHIQQDRNSFVLSGVPGIIARTEIEDYLHASGRQAVRDYYCLA